MAINPNLDPNKDIDDIRDELQTITSMFRDASNSIVDSIKKLNKEQGTISDVTLKNFITIRNTIDRTYSYLNANIGKAIKGEIDRKKIALQIQKIEDQHRKVLGEISNIEKEALLTNGKRRKLLLEAAETLKDQVNYIEDIIVLQRKELDNADLFRKKIQPIAGILKGLGKVPILGDMLNTQRGIEKATEAAQKGAGTWKVFGQGIKGAFTGFGKMLGPISLIITAISLIVKLVKLWFGGMLDADKMNTNIARNLGIQKDLAQQIRSIYRDNKVGVEDIFFTTQNQVEAAEALNNAYGTGYVLSKEILQSQIDLNKVLGLSVEESAALNKIFIGQNMTADQFRKSIISQTLEANKQKGIQLNYKKVYQDIAKLSSEIIVNYKNQIPLIANAVSQMNALGLSMDDASQISSNILDWQSSIESELEAELLMGRQLNAERARVLALNNNIAGAAKAMMEDTGLTLYNFQSMNAVVKGSLAKYLGISVDKLSDALLIQENMKKLSSSELEVLKKRLGSEEKLNEFLKTRNDINTIDKGLMELTIQEKFNQGLLKAKEIFSDFVSGGMLDKLVNILNGIINRISTMFGIGVVSKTKGLETNQLIQQNKNIGNFEKFISSKFAAENAINNQKFLGRATYGLFGGGVAAKRDAIRTIRQGILNRIESGQKISSVADLNKALLEEINANAYLSSHPDRRKEVLNKFDVKEEKLQDDFVMKGNKIVPFRKDDIIMGGTNLLGKDSKEVVGLLREIVDAIKEGGTIMIDGQKVGVAIAKGTYKTS